MATTIDLTSDDVDVLASEIIDLTSVDDSQPSGHVSHDPGVKVEDESSTLVGSSAADSGESSPNTQRDDDTAQTESNTTETHSQDEASNSSDNDLSAIFAYSRKHHKNASGDTPISQYRSSYTHLAPEALHSLVSSLPQKPGSAKGFFTRNCHVNDSSSAKSHQEGRSKTQQDQSVKVQQQKQSTNNTNSQILNIDREEVLGLNKRPKKHRRKPSIEQKPAKPQSRVHEQPSHIPAEPRRGVSETPETASHKTNKAGSSEAVKQSQPRVEFESQRPHKRRKHSRRDDNISSSDSLASSRNITSSKAPPVDKLHSRRPETNSAEGNRVTGKDRVTGIHTGSSRHRSGVTRTHRKHMMTQEGGRQKTHVARAWEQAQKSERPGYERQQGEKTFMLAAPNERGQWERSGSQRSGVPSQQLPTSIYDRETTSGRDWGHHEAHQQPSSGYCGTTGVRLSSENDTVRTDATVQDEDVGEDQEASELRPKQTQKVRGHFGQQESRRIHSNLNTAQPGIRIEQPEQTMSPDTRKKVVENARKLFENHPSNPALKRRVEITNFIPPEVTKPSFSFRSQMVNACNGKRSGRKFRTTTRKAAERDRDRQRQILARRQKLEAEANRLFPNESDENKGKWIEDGIAKLKEIFMKNDQKREAQKSQGLLTVEDLEDMGAAGRDRVDRPPAVAPKGKKRGIPIAEALEPGATITLYVVYISDPFDEDKYPSVSDMTRLGDQFLRREDANKRAESVLRDEGYDDSQLVSIQFRVGPEDGLFFGSKELADGKLVMCMVQRERQMANHLGLSNVFARKELKDTYSSRFDVFYTKVIPKVFLNKDETSTARSKIETLKPKSKSSTPNTDAAEDPAEKERADDDRDSLFSASPTPEPETRRDERAETEGVEQDDDGNESDADSVVTDMTLAPSEPGGNLGSLSWHDVQYMHEHVCGFTTLELANQEAVKVALKLWRPRGNRMDPWLYYRNAIRPSLEESKTQELDVKTAKFEFKVPEFEGHVDDRPWPFIYSTVFVKKTRLEGPRDIGNHIVMDDEGDSGEDGEGDDEGE